MTSAALPPALQARVEHLYAVFGAYPLRDRMDFCPCCIRPEQEAALHERPLREMTPKDLSRYAFKAMSTWGDEEDFKHFLPRLLELLPDWNGHLGTEIVLGKLELGRWLDWPPEEQEAVRAFLLEWWAATVEGAELGETLDGLLTGIAVAEDDLGPYLRRWDEANSPRALKRLAEYVLDHPGGLLGGHVFNAFGDDRPEQARQVRTWLLTERQQRRFEEACEVRLATLEDEALKEAEVFEYAAQTLGILRG